MSSEDCSTKSSSGRQMRMGSTPIPTITPDASKIPARALPVPTSIPR